MPKAHGLVSRELIGTSEHQSAASHHSRLSWRQGAHQRRAAQVDAEGQQANQCPGKQIATYKDCGGAFALVPYRRKRE
jgi:hypothetical protein